MKSFILFSLTLLINANPYSVISANANELGKGSLGTPLYHHYGEDPVNIRTLNFFLPVDHLTLPCYMPIEIKAAYNSYSSEGSIFGDKWTFNHNVRVRLAKTKFQVVEGDGFANPYTKERNLEEAKKVLVEQLLVAKKKADSQAGGLKAPSVYADYKQQLMTNQAFLEEQESKTFKTARPMGPGKYYSFARGPSILEMKPDRSFVRTFQNGALEIFDKEGHLVRSLDRNSNYLSYIYEGDNLLRINDMCGRSVNFSYYTDKVNKGLVSSIKDSIGRDLKYEFAPGQRLKAFVDGAGVRTEYTYDKVGNMTSITTIKGAQKEVISMTYNANFELIRQTGPGAQESKYQRTYVANNKSHSITEVTKYNAGTQVAREVHEFKSKEYESVTKFDGSGKQVKQETKKFSPTTGYPISILDDKGQGDLFDYDAETGNILKRQSVPASETIEFAYDKRCNQVTSMKTTKLNKPAVETTFTFDPKCNLLEAVEMQNKQRRVWIGLQYNDKGKISFLSDKLANKQVAFTYWKFGKPESITLKDVGTLLVKYLPIGEIDKVDTFPHGKGKVRFAKMDKDTYQSVILSEVRGSLDGMLNYLRPAGLNIGL